MKDFVLEVLFHIIGVGAASGLYHQGDSLYLISDDSNYLYAYSIGGDTLRKTVLIAHDSLHERLPKKLKRDFEAIAFDGTGLHVYGSGSSDGGRRDRLVRIGLADGQVAGTRNLAPLYARLRERFRIGIDDFNIEGAVHHAGKVYLFNRGNGPDAVNGIFSIGAGDTAFTRVPLPRLAGVRTGFTDAILVGESLYFLAAAEDAGSVYHDGAVTGTILGRLSFPGLQLQDWVEISDTHKFEGLALFAESDQSISFLLCEDPDDGSRESTVYKLALAKQAGALIGVPWPCRVVADR